MKKFLLLVCLCFIFYPLQAQKSFDELTLNEKIGQTLFVYADVNNAERFELSIKKGLVGGVLIQWGDYSKEETKKLINKLQGWAKESPNKIPLLIAIDYEGGTVYSPRTLGLPFLLSNMLIAAANNYEDTQTMFYIIAQEFKNLGIHINFSPVVDVNINPDNPIIGVRSFGSDKEIVSSMGKAIINGLQKGGVVSVAKHFPGHGETSIDTHKTLAIFNGSEKEFYDIHLYPFKQAIKENVKGIMTAHIRYPFLDNKLATYSPVILTDLLKKKLGFEGIIFSDGLDMKGALLDDISKAAALSIKAGADVALIAREQPEKAIKAITERVPVSRIDDAANKIYNLKKELNLFSEIPNVTDNKVDKAFELFAKKITNQAITLVKNEDNLIPYKTEKTKPKLCAVFFAPTRFANELTYFVKPFLEQDFEVNYYNASLNPKQKDFNRAKTCVSDKDLVVIGSLQWANKEIPAQKQIIDDLFKLNKNTVLLSLMSPYDIKNYPQAKTVLALYGINKFSATTAAEIIMGQEQAQGNLPISF
ncbi:MAG: hypothetical protein J5594_03075 [Elusimicrobiaceae bacterium]|nr:hypothetical protein [Elusimicrobiaceae bacterium]